MKAFFLAFLCVFSVQVKANDFDDLSAFDDTQVVELIRPAPAGPDYVKANVTRNGNTFEMRLEGDEKVILSGENAIGRTKIKIFSPAKKLPLAEVQRNILSPNTNVISLFFDEQLADKLAKIKVVLPENWGNVAKEEFSFEASFSYFSRGDFQNLPLVNRIPTLNKEKKPILNFYNRVKLASSKNVILVHRQSAKRDDEYLLFGKIEKNKFALDYKHPISPLQAFSFAVSQLMPR